MQHRRRCAHPHEIQLVRWLIDAGLNNCQISRSVHIPVGTIQQWRHRSPDWPDKRLAKGRPIGALCPLCHGRDLDDGLYAYLLGMYLGDGYIIRTKKGIYLFAVFQDVRYPGIIAECAEAIEVVRGADCRAGFIPRDGCVKISAYWKHWACLFPQHGVGMKHTRPIRLVEWQQRIADRHPERLIRGLIQSDGWRGMNRVTVRGKRYVYPRYNFSNRSDDIRRIFTDACDALGIRWRRMNRWDISIARREAVETLDRFVGPKR